MATRTPPTPAQVRALLLDAALAVLVGLAAISYIAPSFSGWFHEDDFHNLRWVMEYRDQPWLALTERHSVHDHIRPLTMMSFWLGAAPTDGRYGGMQAVLAGLLMLSLVGLGALAWTQTGQRRAGLVVAALAVGLPGFQRLPDWNAWLCVAGMLAMGTIGLTLALRALDQGSAPWRAAPFLAAAGLYQELGWVVFPAAAALACGARGRWRAAVSSLALGVAGFVWAWHPANATRLDSDALSTPRRVLHFVQTQTGQVLDGWPLWDGTTGWQGPGLLLALVVVVLVRDVVGEEDRRRWWGLSLIVLLLGQSSVKLAGPLVTALAFAALARRWREAPLGLALFAGTWVTMAAVPLANDVNTLAGGYGLALHVGVQLWRWMTARPAVAAVLVVSLLHTGWVRLTAEPVPERLAQAESHDRYLALGALARTLEVSNVRIEGQAIDELEILPLIGLQVEGVAGETGAAGALVLDRLVLPDNADVQGQIMGLDQLHGQPLPNLRSGAETVQRRPGRPRSGPRDDRQDTSELERRGSPLDLAGGYYVIGVHVEAGQRLQDAAIYAMDGCGHVWSATLPARSPFRTALTPLHLASGCAPVRVGVEGIESATGARVFLSPLRQPSFDLWGPRNIKRVLDVSVDGGEQGLVPAAPADKRP